MKEILFRGKTKSGMWVYGYYMLTLIRGEKAHVIAPLTSHMDVTLDKEQYIIDPETVGQYIGITDKNGKKIFEGDIMQLSAGTYPCLVYFDGRGFKWLRNNKRIDIDLTFEKMAVIGNIYDNPEFLKGK